jgi:hypothetical protein
MRDSWNRELWGILHGSHDRPKETPILLGQAWHKLAPGIHPNEPSRALLFNTRESAREWCREKYRKYAGRNDCIKEWWFRPVRVREIVRQCHGDQQP